MREKWSETIQKKTTKKPYVDILYLVVEPQLGVEVVWRLAEIEQPLPQVDVRHQPAGTVHHDGERAGDRRSAGICLKTWIGQKKKDCKLPSASNKHGRQAEHVTRRVWGGVLRNARELIRNDPQKKRSKKRRRRCRIIQCRLVSAREQPRHVSRRPWRSWSASHCCPAQAAERPWSASRCPRARAGRPEGEI